MVTSVPILLHKITTEVENKKMLGDCSTENGCQEFLEALGQTVVLLGQHNILHKAFKPASVPVVAAGE